MTNTINNNYSKLNLNDVPTLPRKELKPEDFMRLFAKQLTSQNPMHPADSSAMLQQMTDISMLGAANSSQKTMEDLKQSINMTLSTSQLLGATNLIGKKVEVPSDFSPLIKDEGLSGSVAVPVAASDVKLTIKNSKGEIVKEINLEHGVTDGLVEFKWDGMLADGKTACDPGDYKISATGTVGDKSIPLATIGTFKVNSVASDGKGNVVLNVDRLGGLGFKDIIKIV